MMPIIDSETVLEIKAEALTGAFREIVSSKSATRKTASKSAPKNAKRS